MKRGLGCLAKPVILRVQKKLTPSDIFQKFISSRVASFKVLVKKSDKSDKYLGRYKFNEGLIGKSRFRLWSSPDPLVRGFRVRPRRKGARSSLAERFLIEVVSPWPRGDSQATWFWIIPVTFEFYQNRFCQGAGAPFLPGPGGKGLGNLAPGDPGWTSRGFFLKPLIN